MHAYTTSILGDTYRIQFKGLRLLEDLNIITEVELIPYEVDAQGNPTRPMTEAVQEMEADPTAKARQLQRFAPQRAYYDTTGKWIDAQGNEAQPESEGAVLEKDYWASTPAGQAFLATLQQVIAGFRV